MQSNQEALIESLTSFFKHAHFHSYPTCTQCAHENKQKKYYVQEPNVLDL
jgi:hypothetical protein